MVGGEGGIRTLGTGKGTHAFQACSIGHSDTSPYAFQQDCGVYAFFRGVTSLVFVLHKKVVLTEGMLVF